MMMQTTMMMQTAPQVSLRPKFAMGAKARAPLRAARRSHVVLAADTVVIGLAADSGCGKSYVSGGSTVCAARHMSIRASAPLFSLLSPLSPSFPSPSLPNWRIRVRNRLISRRFSDGGIDRFDGRLEARWNPSSFLTHARTHSPPIVQRSSHSSARSCAASPESSEGTPSRLRGATRTATR